ncbi:MAG: hypothetical protein V8S76_05585 [Lachnospiraceae bacterium]
MEEPPYDLNAAVIQIDDMDYGLWYLDVSDNPERYEGKKVRFLAKVMKSNRFPQGVFIPGRNAMTCCENDIRFVGYLCKAEFAGLSSPVSGSGLRQKSVTNTRKSTAKRDRCFTASATRLRRSRQMK